jgi:energy-coupling factor transport system permease protein
VSPSGLTMPIGQYLPGSTAVHGLDPRTKLLGTLGFAVCLFTVADWLGVAILCVGLAAVLIGARIPPGYLWRSLRPLLFLLVLTFAFQMFSFPGEPVVSLGPFSITREGLDRGGFLTVRLGLLLVSSAALTLTTPPVLLTDGIEWMLRPLRRIRVPSHEIALMMTIALRFIPTLLREFDDLIKAQRARGVDLSGRDPRRLVSALLPLVIPLFVISFRRADDLAVAMTSRCYRGDVGRTRYRELRTTWADLGATVAALLVFAAALTAGRLWGPS